MVRAKQELSNEQKLALSIVIHYDKLQGFQNGGRIYEIPESAGFQQKDLKSFQSRLSVSVTPLIYTYYKGLFANAKQYDASPDFIQSAIRVAFNYLPKGLQGVSGNINDIIERIRSNNSTKVDRFNAKIGGVYFLYRYAAHIDKDFRDSRDGGLTLPRNRRVIKACIDIKPVQEGERFPRFELRYRPSYRKDYSTSVGSVVLIDGARHMMMFGEDNRRSFPLYVLVNYDAEQTDSFSGLTIRMHDEGQIFAARVYFKRAEGLTFAQATERIRPFDEAVDEKPASGVTPQAHAEAKALAEEVRLILPLIHNRTECADGKTALLINQG